MIKNSKKLITIVGGGNIGSSWALVFLLHGYRVSLYDKNYGVQSNHLRPHQHWESSQAEKFLSP